MILLKISSIYSTWVSSPSSIPVIHRFGLFTVSQISQKFCLRFPEYFYIWYFLWLSYPFIPCLQPKIIFSMFCNLLIRLISEVFVWHSKFLICSFNLQFDFPLVIFFVKFFFYILYYFHYFIQLLICVLYTSLRYLFIILFKILEYTHKFLFWNTCLLFQLYCFLREESYCLGSSYLCFCTEL